MSSINDAHQMVPRSEMPPAVGGFGEAGGGGGEGGLTVAEGWRILKQRKLLVLIIFMLLYAIMIVATLVVWRWFPAYPAQAYLQLRPPQEEVLSPTDPLVDPKIMQLLLETEARKISALNVLSEVLSLPEIKRTQFYQWYGSFEECLIDFQRILSVSVVPDTELIEISLACRDREDARLIVEQVAERYVQRYKDTTTDKSQRSLDEMKDTRAEIQTELDLKQQELADFRKRGDVGAFEARSEMLVRAMADQVYIVNTYDAHAADLQAQLNAIANRDPRTLPISPRDRIIVEADPILRLYRQQVEMLDIEIETAQKLLTGAKHRQMKIMQARRDGLYEREVARREQLFDDLRERQVDGLREELARVGSILARVQEHMAELEARQDDLDNLRLDYDKLVKEEFRLERKLIQVEDALVEFQHIVATTPKDPRLTIAVPPRRAVRPSRPALKLWLGGGMVLALFGAIGLAFLRELTDKAVRTPIDVARHGRLSVLGSIPQLDDEEADVEEIELATRQAPHSLVAEAFRQVRANLVFSGPAESQRVLLITSPGPGNGKTSVAINLAVTLAQSNQRVLLVDCNFRRPAIRSAFTGTRAEGLSNILIGQAELTQLVTSTDLPNLDVLTSGPMPPTPAELLGSKYMQDMIAQAQAGYDRVILDGPPVLLISDALVVATQVDGVIMVARAVDNTKGGLRRAREQLEKINAHVVGAVLNGVQTRAGGYLREQYREFYDYSSDETIPRELPGPAMQAPADPFADDDKDT